MLVRHLASVGTVVDPCLEPGHPVSSAPQRSGILQRDAKGAERWSGRQHAVQDPLLTVRGGQGGTVGNRDALHD
jgi:hypothetical protein